MTWNYRVMQIPDESEETGYILGIHEVYYDGDKPTGWTEHPIIVGATLEELSRVLDMMRLALGKDVLPYELGSSSQ